MCPIFRGRSQGSSGQGRAKRFVSGRPANVGPAACELCRPLPLAKASDPKVDLPFWGRSDASSIHESIVGAENRIHFSARCSKGAPKCCVRFPRQNCVEPFRTCDAFVRVSVDEACRLGQSAAWTRANPFGSFQVLARATYEQPIVRHVIFSFKSGQPYQTLYSHLSSLEFTPKAYRRKWGLFRDYSMAAPAERERSRALRECCGHLPYCRRGQRRSCHRNG